MRSDGIDAGVTEVWLRFHGSDGTVMLMIAGCVCVHVRQRGCVCACGVSCVRPCLRACMGTCLRRCVGASELRGTAPIRRHPPAPSAEGREARAAEDTDKTCPRQLRAGAKRPRQTEKLGEETKKKRFFILLPQSFGLRTAAAGERGPAPPGGARRRRFRERQRLAPPANAPPHRSRSPEL